MSFRPEKMASIIRDTTAMVVREIPQKEFGIISITEVDVSGDLGYATIFVSALKNPEAAIKAVEKKRHEILERLGSTVETFRVPILRFKWDDRGEKADRLEQLLGDS